MDIQKLIQSLRDLRDDGIENKDFGKKLLKNGIDITPVKDMSIVPIVEMKTFLGNFSNRKVRIDVEGIKNILYNAKIAYVINPLNDEIKIELYDVKGEISFSSDEIKKINECLEIIKEMYNRAKEE
jgi:hypothetical protein